MDAFDFLVFIILFIGAGLLFAIVLTLVYWVHWKILERQTRRKGREWCDICKAPQWVTPDGEHRCVEEIDL